MHCNQRVSQSQCAAWHSLSLSSQLVLVGWIEWEGLQGTRGSDGKCDRGSVQRAETGTCTGTGSDCRKAESASRWTTLSCLMSTLLCLSRGISMVALAECVATASQLSCRCAKLWPNYMHVSLQSRVAWMNTPLPAGACLFPTAVILITSKRADRFLVRPSTA